MENIKHCSDRKSYPGLGLFTQKDNKVSGTFRKYG